MVETFTKNPDFFGRSDVLRRLDECLLPSKDLIVASQPDRIRVGVLTGMPGLGKTETAIEYVYNRQHEFDCIFWIRAKDTGKLEADIAHIATSLGIHDTSDPLNRTANKGLALGWLTNPFKIEHRANSPQRTTASWLIVFDNADDLEILLPYKYIANCGAVLITSRDPRSKTLFSPSSVDVELNVFDDKESGMFLQRITDEDHEDEAILVGSKLGGLPIAIAQMGRMICSKYLTFSEFLDLYDNPVEETEVLETDSRTQRETSRGNISTIWAIEKLSKEARAVIEVLAFLDPDSIQDTILPRDESHFSTIPYYPKRNITFYDARKELLRSSLIRRNDQTGEFWVHRVVKHAVMAKLTPEHRLQVFTSVISRIASKWPAALGAHDPTLWNEMESLYPHVVSLTDIYKKYLRESWLDNHIDLAKLILRATWFAVHWQP